VAIGVIDRFEVINIDQGHHRRLINIKLFQMVT
jgi:hypothetical protein